MAWTLAVDEPEHIRLRKRGTVIEAEYLGPESGYDKWFYHIYTQHQVLVEEEFYYALDNSDLWEKLDELTEFYPATGEPCDICGAEIPFAGGVGTPGFVGDAGLVALYSDDFVDGEFDVPHGIVTACEPCLSEVQKRYWPATAARTTDAPREPRGAAVTAVRVRGLRGFDGDRGWRLRVALRRGRLQGGVRSLRAVFRRVPGSPTAPGGEPSPGS